MATVSIVLPTFNRLRYLPEAIASVQAQTFSDWELLVVDDGSTDGTAEYVRALGDPRIHLILEPHRGNVAAARNRGLLAARALWVGFLDSDDRWLPEKLAMQLAAVGRQEWCYSAYRMIDEEGRETRQRVGGPWRPYSGSVIRPLVTTDASIALPTVLVRRELADRLRFDERLPFAEDYDFLLRLADQADAVVVDHVVAEFREHPGRTTRGRYETHVGKAMAYRKFARAAPADLAGRCRRLGYWHVLASLRLARRQGALARSLRWLPRIWRV